MWLADGTKNIVSFSKCRPVEPCARWGVVEWIEHPIQKLEVQGSNPGHINLKKIPLL